MLWTSHHEVFVWIWTGKNNACDVICGATVSRGESCEPAMQALTLLDDTNGLQTIFVRDDFHTHRFPESCIANFLSVLLCDQHCVLQGQQPFHTLRVPRFFRLARCSQSICRSVGHGKYLRVQYTATMARRSECAKYHLASVGKYELNNQKSLYQQLAPACANELL